jgi:hypothetical protein
MSTPSTAAAAVLIEKRNEFGLSKSGSEQPSTQTIDVTISGAPDAAKGANGNYSLHKTPLSGHTIPYYQGISGDLFQMFIIYNKTAKRWELQNNIGTENEKRFGLIAYIACGENDAETSLLRSVSGKKEWYVPTKPGGSDGVLDSNMVATVIDGGQSTAAPAASSTVTVAPASPASPAASTTVVSTPASPPIVVTAPARHEMKTIITDIGAQYNKVSGEYAKLTTTSPDTEWSDFKTNNLDKANTDLKKALAQLDAFKKAGSGSSTSTAASDPAKSGLIDEGMIRDRNDMKDGRNNTKDDRNDMNDDSPVGGSSSSSKKNRKSHKSYHPGIGKTRKHHHSHSEPKRVSFVHQA